MIRSSIFTAIKDALPSEVQHCALWNHNVEFVEQDTAWDRPAVFVEFGSMELQPTKAQTYHIRGTLRLHVVIDFDVYDETAVFELTDSIIGAVRYVSGTGFQICDASAIYTNHNHEDLIEEIVSFTYSADMIVE